MNKSQKKTTQRVAITAVALGVVVTVPVGFAMADDSGDTSATAECHITQLELPDDVTKGTAEAISNKNGYIVGGPEWLWQDEYLSIMEGIQGDVGNFVAAVNSSGVATGTAEGESDFGAWTYQDGAVTELLAPGGDPGGVTNANDINDDGTVVGSYRLIDSSAGDAPVKWDAGADEATALEIEDGKWGRAEAVSADGTIVGTVYETTDDPEAPFGNHRAWMWSADGDSQELPLLPGAERGKAVSISGDWVLMSTMGDEPTYYRWNKAEAGQPEALELATANDINSSGRVFGAVDAKVAGFEDADGITELPNVVDKTGAEVRSVSDGGAMVGVSGDKPVLWVCH
jgi:uncharacterized membrane protein